MDLIISIFAIFLGVTLVHAIKHIFPEQYAAFQNAVAKWIFGGK